MYHEQIKHIEVDCHFIREKILENEISIGHVKTGEQLGDLFTKALMVLEWNTSVTSRA